jgi:hypothetical protein
MVKPFKDIIVAYKEAMSSEVLIKLKPKSIREVIYINLSMDESIDDYIAPS